MAKRLVAGGVAHELLDAEKLQMSGLGRHLEAPRRVGAVDLAVVEHVRRLAAHRLLDVNLGRRLDPVVGHHPRECPHPGRVVLLRLARERPERARGQPDRGAGRAHLRDARPVERRDRDRARARVEITHVADRGRVEHHDLHVDRRLPGVRHPASLDGGVVEHLHLDPVLADAVVPLIERQPGGVDDRPAGHAGAAEQRRAGVDRERLAAESGSRRACGRRSSRSRFTPTHRGEQRARGRSPPLSPLVHAVASLTPALDTNVTGTSVAAPQAGEHERRDARVAVGVDRVRAEHRLAVLDREEIVHHGRAVARGRSACLSTDSTAATAS